MSQSLSKVYLHLIFSTKGRITFIQPEWENQLYAYMVGIFSALSSPVVFINGTQDHVHILFCQSKNHSLAKIAEEVKKSSSKWVKAQNYQSMFAWQGGYAAFSVSSSRIDTVRKYIEKQKEHHKKESFENEIVEFMTKYDVENFEKRYFFE